MKHGTEIEKTLNWSACLIFIAILCCVNSSCCVGHISLFWDPREESHNLKEKRFNWAMVSKAESMLSQLTGRVIMAEWNSRHNCPLHEHSREAELVNSSTGAKTEQTSY